MTTTTATAAPAERIHVTRTPTGWNVLDGRVGHYHPDRLTTFATAREALHRVRSLQTVTR